MVDIFDVYFDEDIKINDTTTIKAKKFIPAYIDTKNKPEKPFGCLFKMQLPGPCLKLTESWDSAFFMGTHSDSDFKD